MSALRAGVHWLLRDDRTGRLVVAQWPNTAIWIFLAAAVLRLLGPDSAAPVLRGVATLALLWWAVQEIRSGVNPFRRMLGTGVLVWQMVAFLPTVL